jgi:hypothetical protein
MLTWAGRNLERRRYQQHAQGSNGGEGLRQQLRRLAGAPAADLSAAASGAAASMRFWGGRGRGGRALQQLRLKLRERADDALQLSLRLFEVHSRRVLPSLPTMMQAA